MDCSLIQLDDGQWWCEECDEHQYYLLPVNARRNCHKRTGQQSREGQLHGAISRLTGLKQRRTEAEITRLIAHCLHKCEKRGTGRWGDVTFWGCPYAGRPCGGALKKWARTIADPTCWCDEWGPEIVACRESVGCKSCKTR